MTGYGTYSPSSVIRRDGRSEGGAETVGLAGRGRTHDNRGQKLFVILESSGLAAAATEPIQLARHRRSMLQDCTRMSGGGGTARLKRGMDETLFKSPVTPGLKRTPPRPRVLLC